MKYYRVDLRNKAVILNFPFDKKLIEDIKKCSFKAHWNSELKHWIIPIEGYSRSTISNLIKSHNFQHKPSKQELMKPYNYRISQIAMDKIVDICNRKQFTYLPRKYQLEALYYGLKMKNLINGDDVGIGKTFEAIIYAEIVEAFPCLVIVPASVKYNWAEKWREIVGSHRTISVIESKETKNRINDWNADVVIINYDIIGKKAGSTSIAKFDQLMTTVWKMFIFDEGHFLKDSTSQRSVVARKITKKSSGIIQLLTGTATMSKPAELWNLLVLIKKDHLIAESWDKFILRYCGAYRGKFGWFHGGATNMLELNKKLRDVCYLRREKRDVLSQLPQIEKVIIQMPITNKSEILRAEQDVIQYLRETKGEEAAEAAMEAQHLVSLGVLRKLAIEGKMKAIEQFLRDWKIGGKKLLIFGIHRETLEELSSKFGGELIAGGVSSKKKQEIVKGWMINDDVFLFANMQSAGTGVDGLQEVCSNMLILELPWRPSDLTQVIARIDRSGQIDPSTVRFMLSDETIDQDMWKMLEEKEAVTEAVNKGIDVLEEKSGMRTVIKLMLKRAQKKE